MKKNIIMVGHCSCEETENLILQTAIQCQNSKEAKDTTALIEFEAIFFSTFAELRAAAEDGWVFEKKSIILLTCSPADIEGEFFKKLKIRLGNNLIFSVEKGFDSNILRKFEKHAYQSNPKTINPSLKKIATAENNNAVVVVGAGIVGLMIAHRLCLAGYRVQIIDSMPDPSDGVWLNGPFGCTFAGGNARIFSYNEARNHTYKLDESGQLVNYFSKSLHEGGWCADALSRSQQEWAHAHSAIPPWLYKIFDEDITSFNKSSHKLWDSLFEQSPHILNRCEHKEGILRLYSEPQQFSSAQKKEKELGAIKRVISLTELSKEQPALESSLKNKNIAGCIEVLGFSVRIHDFAKNLIKEIKNLGGCFSFEEQCTKIIRDKAGKISSLSTNIREIRAEHYVFSTGSHDSKILAQLQIPNLVQTVFGAWLRLDNQNPNITKSIKLTRSGLLSRGAAEGANIIAEGTSLWISSGHAWTAHHPDGVSSDEREKIFQPVLHAALTLFPDQLDLINEKANNPAGIQICCRPWSLGSLGIFHAEQTLSGKCIVATGHNTGGFAQAPTTAEAVLSALRETEHPMHFAYHPNRALETANFLKSTGGNK